MQKVIAQTLAELPMQQPCKSVDERSDDEIALEARRNSEAFAVLYRRYAVGVYRYLSGKVGSQTDAEDLTSQTFIAGLESLHAYRPQGKFAAWIFSIARRKAADFYRKDAKAWNLPLESAGSLLFESDELLSRVAQGDLLHRLGKLVALLNEDQQELIRLRYAAGLTYAQIGQILGRSDAAVGMALHRLITKLRTQIGIQEEFYDEEN